MIARKKGLGRNAQSMAWPVAQTRNHDVRPWRQYGPGWELTFDVGQPLRIVLVFKTVQEAEAVAGAIK
jgi:hypothetical protein